MNGKLREIRGTHPYHYRCDQWARLVGTTELPFPEGDRRVYLVEFPDGITDFWAVDGGWEYEFR